MFPIALAALLAVPFVAQQHGKDCGAAAASMVAGYWGRALPERPVKELTGSALAALLTRAGLRSFVFAGTWEDLKENARGGRPLILCLRRHYVVLTGVDGDRLWVHDPARRAHVQLDRAELEKTWDKNWTLLAVPEAPR